MKEAIYIQALNPSTNRDGGHYNLPPVWNNIIKAKLMKNGAGTTTAGGEGDQSEDLLAFPFLEEITSH